MIYLMAAKWLIPQTFEGDAESYVYTGINSSTSLVNVAWHDSNSCDWYSYSASTEATQDGLTCVDDIARIDLLFLLLIFLRHAFPDST